MELKFWQTRSQLSPASHKLSSKLIHRLELSIKSTIRKLVITRHVHDWPLDLLRVHVYYWVSPSFATSQLLDLLHLLLFDLGAIFSFFHLSRKFLGISGNTSRSKEICYVIRLCSFRTIWEVRLMASHTGVTQWRHPMASTNGITQWRHTHTGGTQWCHTMASHNGVTQWCRTMASHNGVTQWRHTMAKHNGITQWCHTMASHYCDTH